MLKDTITMRKLISIAKTDVLASLLPIMMWMLASAVYTMRCA